MAKTPGGDRERRGRPTQAEALEKRNHIIAAATELFLSSGYTDVSVRQIAERADVSTRTVYNLFDEKASLFNACLDSISPDASGSLIVDKGDLRETLERFAIMLVELLSRPQGLGFARLVMVDGKDMPELAAAGYANQTRQFVTPLTEYLRTRIADSDEAEEMAKLFIAMAISEWNRSMTFHLPLPDQKEVAMHAGRVARLFERGCPQS